MQRVLTAILVSLVLTSVSSAQFHDCPECGSKVATGVPKNTKVKKKVYSVECQDIAVPNICLPKPFFSLREQLGKLFKPKCIPGDPCGESCGNVGCTTEPVRQGQVRTVKVLKKKTVECEKCAYKWEVTDLSKQEVSTSSMSSLENLPPIQKVETAQPPIVTTVRPFQTPDLRNNPQPTQPPTEKRIFHRTSAQAVPAIENRPAIIGGSPGAPSRSRN